MTACRLLSELMPEVRALIDQPAEDTSQLAYSMDQLVAAANVAHAECFMLASQLDANWCTTEADISVAQGADYVALPDNLYSLGATMEWDTSTKRKKRDIPCGEWSQLGLRNYDALFKPKDVDHGNVATLRFMRPFPKAATIRVVYDYLPPRLLHGELPVDSGGLAMMLAAYESQDSCVGQTLYIVSDPVGEPTTGGAFGSKVITGWNGKLKVAGFADAWNPVPMRAAVYSTRPDIPPGWERFFVMEWAVHLGLKMSSDVVEQWKAERARLEVRKKHQASTVERRAARLVRFRPVAGRGLTGDPINGPSGLGL